MPRFAPHPDRRPAVVSGASSGIGRAAAVALAALGHPVALGARRVERCEAAVDEIRAAGGEAVALALDVTDDESVAAFVQHAEQKLGPLEVLVSNAGDVQPVGAVEATPEQFTQQVEVNLLGAQRLVHHLVPPMRQRGRGDVVLVTSDVVRSPRPGTAGYVAAKSGLEGLGRTLQMELEGTGVRVGMVRPGPSSTEQGTGWSEEDVNRVMADWERWGLLRHGGYLRPSDVAAAVLAVVGTPPGTMLALVEVQPEAPPPKPARSETEDTSA